MDLIECTCRGENPECFRCEGRGYVPRPVTAKTAYRPPFVVEGVAKPTMVAETLPFRRAPTGKPRQGLAFVRCACGQRVAVRELAVHDRRCSKRPRTVRPSGPRTSVPFEAEPQRASLYDLPRGDAERRATRDERRLDATRGVGHFAREQGRYGSPCTYDGMDDDSNA